jgi:uncharacterized OsmC-like protein
MAGRPSAFNPAELFLAAVAACMLKGIERVAPMINFDFQGAEVLIHATRQDSPPKLVALDYELVVETPESDRRLALLHKNIRKYGAICNTVASAAAVNGIIRRKPTQAKNLRTSVAIC